MTLKLRFTLLLSLLLLSLAATVVVVRQLERSETNATLRAERQLRAQLLNHWVDATSRALPQLATDLSQSESFRRTLGGSAETTQAKLRDELLSAGMAAIWVLRSDGSVSLEANTPGSTTPVPFPLEKNAFNSLTTQTPNPRFFAESKGELLEIAIRRLQPATPPHEWIAIARRWDDTQLRTLGGLADGRIEVVRADEVVEASPSRGRVQITRPLSDWQGHPLRALRVEYDVSDVELASRVRSRHVLVLLAFGGLLIVALGVALYRWVLQPLETISQSLASGKADLAEPIASERHELGRVAQLVVASAAQRAALQREVDERTRAEEALARSEKALRENIEERARLGRDLHDGVIQSLYAAGMGLAGVRMQLRTDQVEAANQLEQTRNALNETIHDVRNFIVGLEPESLKLQSFSQAVSKLLEAMQSLRPFKESVQIDDGVASRLTLAQRVHALQITREAVSNALRHGEAAQVHVTLRAPADMAEFEISDDGRGFDTSSAAVRGKGLDNFAQRARELGGELAVESRPGHGTRVRLLFSL